MKPEKKVLAAKRGMRVLSERIVAARRALQPLEKAYTALHTLKYDAELQIVPVQKIPTGMTRAKQVDEEKKLRKFLDNMSPQQAHELFADLERRVG